MARPLTKEEYKDIINRKGKTFIDMIEADYFLSRIMQRFLGTTDPMDVPRAIEEAMKVEIDKYGG